MWNYLVDVTERSIQSAKNMFWFFKSIFILGYFFSCLGVNFYNGFKSVSLVALVVISVDLLVFLTVWILTNVIIHCGERRYERLKLAICILNIISVFLRLIGGSLFFTNSIISIDAGIGSLGINVVILLVSTLILTFILIKEYVIFLIRYFKYRAKKEVKRFNRIVFGETREEREEIS